MVALAAPIKKPLGGKAYGSIGHLPGSRLGVGDHHIQSAQAGMLTSIRYDKHDTIYVQEKLDGSCVTVAKIGGDVIALNRAGYPAISSPHVQHRVFHYWVEERRDRFADLLREGERVAGEWLAQAHGTRYLLPHEPFVAFDILNASGRVGFSEFTDRIGDAFTTPDLLHVGGPLPVSQAVGALDPLKHGAVDEIEGVIYRLERRGRPLLIAKWVRQGKVDGYYLFHGAPVWNWTPPVRMLA